jgi:hypothetical protein
VTPIYISTSISGLEVMPAFATLTLHFVPEPGTLVLFGSGIAGFVLFGRSRRSGGRAALRPSVPGQRVELEEAPGASYFPDKQSR